MSFNNGRKIRSVAWPIFPNEGDGRNDWDGADRLRDRGAADLQLGGRAVHREDVVRDDHVDAQHGADHLHLVPEALGEERPDGAVDHARVERGLLGGLALALEEAAGDLAGRVHLLLDVDGEREEVRAGAGLLRSHDGRQDDGVAAGDDHRAIGLLGHLPGREAQGDVPRGDLDGDLGAENVTHVDGFPSAASDRTSRAPPSA